MKCVGLCFILPALILFVLTHFFFSYSYFNRNSLAASSSPSATNGQLNKSVNSVIAPNKSTLFSSVTQSNETTINSRSSSNINGSSSSSSNSINITNIVNRMVPNNNKPYCAPKPPGIQILANKTVNGTARATITRHQSMKSPR